jgi:PAS domain S-box-containing protein
MLLCMLTLPSGQALPVLRQILLPVLLVYPIGSLLLCVIIYNRLSNLTMEKEIREHDKKILELIEQSPSGIVLTERHRVHFVNSTFLKMTGWTAEEFIKRGFEGITHPDDLEKSLDKFGKLLAGEIDDYEMEKRYLRPDGSFLWGYLAVVALKHNGVRTGQNMCMIKDITDIVKANEEKEKRDEECRRLYQQYHEKQQLLLALLDSIPDLIFYKNTEFEYMGCNRAFEVFAGRSEEEVLGKTDFDLFDRETASRFREMDEKMIARNLPQRNEEQVTYPNGSKIYLDTLKTPYYDAEGNLLGLIGISRDITHRKEREDEIQYLNFHDVLTGLYNRSYFEQARRQLDKEESLPLSVIIGDINGLKLINDAFGHAEGDQCCIESPAS